MDLKKYISENGENILSRLNMISEDDIVYLSGSLVEEIGNKYSDLDVFVLSDNLSCRDSEYDYGTYKVSFFNLNGVNCDVEYWETASIKKIINQVSSINLNDLDTRTINLIKLDNLSFENTVSLIHRFLNSICIHNEEKMETMKRQLDIDVLYRIISRGFINKVDGGFDDIIGNYEAGEYETAYLNCNIQVIELMKAYIFSYKYTIDRNKWVYKKLDIISKKFQECLYVKEKFEKLYIYSNVMNESNLKLLVEKYIEFFNEVIDLISARLGGI